MRRCQNPFIPLPAAFSVLLAVTALATPLEAAELVQGVRSKLSAADLSSGEAAVEIYRLAKGVDPEYLNAVGWLARGAEMLGKRDKAAAWVAELRREIPAEAPGTIVPLGAAIEVEGKLALASGGRGAAIRFLEGELVLAKDTALRSRIRKNLNVLTLEGEKAPEILAAETLSGPPVRLADLSGRPVLLFFWASWCGDCKADGAKLARLREKYAPKGLVLVAPTRLYGSVETNKDASPAEEKAHVRKVFAEAYPGLEGVSVPVDTETMVRYGASATPTYTLVDRKGRVRFYAPTRVSEAELERLIESVLSE
jgi:thiol-disulfide isomerase/thioredoxin